MSLRRKPALTLVAAAVALIVIATALIVVVRRRLSDPAPAIQHRVQAPDPDPAELDENSALMKSALPYFHRVSPLYTRGSQPGRDGVELLSRLGVKTIIDLRSRFEHTDAISLEAQSYGIKYVWIPLGVWDPPSDNVTDQFLNTAEDGANAPVFVFCTDGLNRTGMMTAIYRISHDGWTAERAIKEMDEAGFGAYWYSLRSYVWDYARAHSKNRDR